jgi:hypothetical protein
MKCPKCRNVEFNGKHCRFCGCRAEINEQSGNVIYMVRGRVVAAPDDLREQYAKHDARYGIKGPDPINFDKDE